MALLSFPSRSFSDLLSLASSLSLCLRFPNLPICIEKERILVSTVLIEKGVIVLEVGCCIIIHKIERIEGYEVGVVIEETGI